MGQLFDLDRNYKKYKIKLQTIFRALICKENKKLVSGFGFYLRARNLNDKNWKIFYYEFYKIGLSKPNCAFLDGYLELIDKASSEGIKDTEQFFNYATNLLKNKTGKRYISYITKLIHTFDCSFPIIDKKVKDFFGYKSEFNFEIIMMIKNFYDKFSKDCEQLIKTFKDKYKMTDSISSTKTIDFAIWAK